MTVVRNEFEAGENNPEGVLSQRILAVAYEWHNYGKSTIGNRSDIERVPIENLQAFYKKYYRPDNMMLVVAGNFKVEKALPLIVKYFGLVKKPEEPLDATYTEEPAQDGERTVVLRRVGTRSDGWVTYFYTPESIAGAWQRIRGYAEDAGRDPDQLNLVAQVPLCIGDSYEEATRKASEYVGDYFDVPAWSEATPDSAVCPR